MKVRLSEMEATADRSTQLKVMLDSLPVEVLTVVCLDCSAQTRVSLQVPGSVACGRSQQVLSSPFIPAPVD